MRGVVGAGHSGCVLGFGLFVEGEGGEGWEGEITGTLPLARFSSNSILEMILKGKE